MANGIQKDLGKVTAYSYAKAAGYTGTEAEFQQVFDEFTRNAPGLITRMDTAVERAEAAVTNIDATVQDAVDDAVEEATASAVATANQAVSDAQAAQTAAEGAVTQANNAVTQANAAVTAAQAAQSAAEDAAESFVLDRTLTDSGAAAPADLVGDLKESICENIGDVFHINIFDKNSSEIVLGKYFNSDNTQSSDNNAFISGFIPVNPGVYTANFPSSIFGYTNNYVGGYDLNKTNFSPIYGTLSNSNSRITFTVPDGVKYIKINGRKKYIDSYMVIKGDASNYPASYIAYNDMALSQIMDGEITEIVRRETGTPVQKVHVESVNLFDKSQIVTGEYLKDNGVGTGTRYSHSGIIDLSPGTYLFPSSTSTYGTFNGKIVVFYNSSDERTSYEYATLITNTSILKITIAEASRISFNIGTNAANTAMLVRGEDADDWPESYVDYFAPFDKVEENVHLSETMKSDIASYVNQNPLNGKIVSFNGDSICYGAGYAGGYGKIIADRNQMIYENIGESGATICAETYAGQDNPRMWICRTVDNMRSDADYVILEGGVNDAYSDAAVGQISEGYTATLDDTIFAQAFEKMLVKALTRFPGKKIGYIAVHKVEHWSSLDTGDYSKYRVAIECCKKWGIPVCDLNDDCPPFGLLNEYTSVGAAIRTAYTSNGDGWHPNENGYKKYYCDKIEAWMKTL